MAEDDEVTFVLPPEDVLSPTPIVKDEVDDVLASGVRAMDVTDENAGASASSTVPPTTTTTPPTATVATPMDATTTDAKEENTQET